MYLRICVLNDESGDEYLIGWIGTNKSSDEAIFDKTDGTYNVMFECKTPNISLPIDIKGNITECDQKLTGKIDVYYNESGMSPIFYRLDLEYWMRNDMWNKDNPSQFMLDPCNTEYPLDIKVFSLTNAKYGASGMDVIIKTEMSDACPNGYNNKMTWIPDTTTYGISHLLYHRI